MDELPIKESRPNQSYPPQHLRPRLHKGLLIRLNWLIGGLIIFALPYLYKHLRTLPASNGTIPVPNVKASGDELKCSEQPQNCTFCIIEVPPERAQLPAVGFDLTESYGTATIILHSGETINIGPIYGNKEYSSAIVHFSKNSSKHTAPPYNWWYDPPGGVFAGLFDAPREWLRTIRKRVGLAATPQVGALGSLIFDLRAAASSALAFRNVTPPAVDAVVLSSIDLVALYDEDLYDAAEYAGLSVARVPVPPPIRTFPFTDHLLSDFRFQRQPKHVDAAQVGLGLGLCKSYLSTAGCSREEQEMYNLLGYRRNLLSVHVTRRGVELGLRRDKVTAATSVLYWQQHESYFDRSLGVANLMVIQDDPENEAAYWESFKKFVVNLLKVEAPGNVTDVFMAGESVKYARFKENVVSAITGAEMPQQAGEPVVHERDAFQSLFLASKGAAEIARRVLVAPRDFGAPEGLHGIPLCRP